MSNLTRRVLRSSDVNIFLIGPVTVNISGAKLPSKGQVLKVLFYNMRVIPIKDAKESARLTIREVAIFWEKAKIPMRQEHRCVDVLMHLYKKWDSLHKNCNRSLKSKQLGRRPSWTSLTTYSTLLTAMPCS